MFSAITMIILIAMVTPFALGNIFAYPVSKKLCLFISNRIVKVLAPRVFAALKILRGFCFFGYNETKENLPDNFIIISNHQSLLDIPLYMIFFRNREVRFVAKDALGRHVPLVSEMLRCQQHCIIPRRAKPMDAMRYLGEFGERCKNNNWIPIIFPEGSRTRDGNVGKFYSAGVRKLTESGLPVVVCALDGGYRLRDLRKIFSNLKKGSYRVKVLKVYDCPKTKEECNAILEESRVIIQKQVEEWRNLPLTQKY